MRSLLSVINSDSINRYGYRFSVGALVDSLDQSWQTGVPMHLGHNQHKLIGLGLGFGVFSQPRSTLLLGTSNFPENGSESQWLAEHVSSLRSSRVKKTYSEEIPILTQKLERFLSSKSKLIDVGTIAYVDAGLAKQVAPKYFSKQDKDGLVEVDQLQTLEPGVFKFGDLLLFAHQFFRRSQSRFNTLNFPFLEAFWDLRHDQPKKIALDEDLVGLASTYKRSLELSYWYGPRFNNELPSIANNVSMHKASDADRVISGINQTEFWWYEQKGLKTFECEEVLDVPMYELGDDAYGLRFTHSILDPATGLPNHLDGAIRQYSFEQICNRFDSNIRDFGRNAVYKKLWRIDGNISVESWKTLITHYYRDNHSVAEYFDGKDVSEAENPKLVESKSLYQSLVPWRINDGQGICMLMAYDTVRDYGVSDSRFAVPLDTVSVAGETRSFIEQEAVELDKLLRRTGQSLGLPDDCVFIAFEDLSYNFPVIQHIGHEAVQRANETMKALATLCREWQSRGDCRVLTITCRIQYEEKNIGFSFAGTATDFDTFLHNDFSFPMLESDAREWYERQAAVITKLYPKSQDYPDIAQLTRLTGILQLQRKFLDAESYELDQQGTDLVAVYQGGDKEVVSYLREGLIRIAPAFEIIESSCTRCGQEYRECDCSKVVDNGVRQRISKCHFRGCYWTCAPAL